MADYTFEYIDNKKSQEEVEATLSIFLQEELRADQFVNLAQAGHTNDDRTPLARVFVDLRAATQEKPRQSFLVVDTIQQASDRTIKPTLINNDFYEVIENQRRANENDVEDVYAIDIGEALTPEEVEYLEGLEDSNKESNASATQQPHWANPSRFVIVGGPGQGKSTLAQQLAQRHRAALLKVGSTRKLEQETSRILRVIEQAANESGIGLPKHPRWPFRVVLEQFADALAKGKVKSVLEYIASQIQRRTKRDFEARDAEKLLATTAWFVAFDGLDEVPAVSNRAEVLDAVRQFLLVARYTDADLLVIATTRPQGYEHDFAHANFNHVNLKPLSPQEALDYADKFVKAKYIADSDRQERIMQRLEAAAREESIVRLMQTPLQVTIMAALVDLVGNPPRERYLLFQRYYEIIYQREQERGLTLSDVLAHYRAGIEILHDRIGLLLQLEAESKGKAESRLSRARLERIVHDYLVAEEFTGEALERTKANFMDVALFRLVFIVPLQDERYGFEVRSLQEFSAARALMRGSYSAVKERLRAIAPVPYWRNTMLFAIGRAFAEQDEPQCDMVMQLCRELNDNEQEPILSRTFAGSRLALDILEDGIVAWRPGYRRQFIEIALQLLRLPHRATAVRLAGCYTAADEQRYEKAIQVAFASSGTEVPMGVFAALAALAQREDAPSWAQETIRKYWPTQIEEEAALLEQVYSLLIVDEWSTAMVTRVAGATDMDWVASHLVGNNAPKWVRDVRKLRRGREKQVFLAGKPEAFSYYVTLGHVQQEVLDRLAEAQPTHYEWQPFLVGQAFMSDPSPETLADAIEALVRTNSWKPGLDYGGLPWQLATLLNYSESVEELLHHAQRARKGDLGSNMDWLAAEHRWGTQPFTVDDLTAFTDAEWPYTAKIADRGILPIGYMGIEPEDDDNVAVLSLLEAFKTMPSWRYKSYVAIGLLLLLNHGHNPNNPIVLPLDTILDITNVATWQIQAMGLLAMLDPAIDWKEEVQTLDALGSRISVLGNQEDGHTVIENRARKIVPQLMLLLTKQDKQVREGLLRFAAAIAIAQIAVPVPDISLEMLTEEGRLAIITLNLLSETPILDNKSLVQQVLALWSHPHPKTGIHEMTRVLRLLLDRPRLSYYVINMCNSIYLSPLIDGRTKVKIIDSFMSQVQYRTSELDNPLRRKQLATGWLLEVLNQ